MLVFYFCVAVVADTQLADPLKCLIIYSYTSVIDVRLHWCPGRSLSEHHAHYVHCEDLQAGDLNQSCLECAHCEGEESRWKKERHIERRGNSNQKWKKRRGTLIDSCLAWCLLRLFPPSTAIISRRTSPSPWQGLCHPSPLEDAIPFGRRWIGVPSPRMRSLWTESLQREHSGVNRLYVNTDISDISVENTPPQSSHWPSNSCLSNWSVLGNCLWCGSSKLLSSTFWIFYICSNLNKTNVSTGDFLRHYTHIFM